MKCSPQRDATTYLLSTIICYLSSKDDICVGCVGCVWGRKVVATNKNYIKIVMYLNDLEL